MGKYLGSYKSEKEAKKAYNNYIRLVYPDGRIIDCACDVETLKQRVVDGNWL